MTKLHLLGVILEGGLDDVFDPHGRHGCLEDSATVSDVANDVELPITPSPEPDLELALLVDAGDAEARLVAPCHPVRPLLSCRCFLDETGRVFPCEEARLACVHLFWRSPFILSEAIHLSKFQL